MPSITARFDSGNIEVLGEDTDSIRLAIRQDEGSSHFQWFHFRVSDCRGQALRWRITNAAQASYVDGWRGYQACASYDHEHWFRVSTHYEGGELIINHTPEHDVVWYAYFAPYSMERHAQLIGRCQMHSRARLTSLGSTLDGRTLDMLTIGEPSSGRKSIWIIGRQHPGETMAQWLIEGLLERLLDVSDALARRILEDSVLYVVPNMNPDGSFRGHLRTNAKGTNLNRAWETPERNDAPEVWSTVEAMKKTGVSLCLDVHGDESIPYNFIAGPDGVSGLDNKILMLRDQYAEALERACPDFQREHGYPTDEPGRANMSMATNAIAHMFGALAMTLEQPFKDNANLPDPQHGWSPSRCKALGRSQLDAIAAVVDQLPT